MKKSRWIILIVLICVVAVSAAMYVYPQVFTRTNHVKKNPEKAAQARAELKSMMLDAKVCKVDSDCIAVPAFGSCASGSIAINKGANIKKMQRKSYQIYEYDGKPAYECASPKVNSGVEIVVCVQNGCELQYK